MYTYKQTSGRLQHDGIDMGFGFSGQREGMNNPAEQDDEGIGPIPQGTYLIGPAYDHTPANGYPHNLGPVVMNLTPDQGNQMFGRKDFRIHGASADHPSLSSHGCIILPRPLRILIAAGPDKILQVIA